MKGDCTRDSAARIPSQSIRVEDDSQMKGDCTHRLVADDRVAVRVEDDSQMKGDCTWTPDFPSWWSVEDDSQMKGDCTPYKGFKPLYMVEDDSQMKGDCTQYLCAQSSLMLKMTPK